MCNYVYVYCGRLIWKLRFQDRCMCKNQFKRSAQFAMTGSILWDEEILSIPFDPIKSTLLDWPHCLIASSGVGSVQLNLFLRMLLSSISQDEMEAFLGRVRFSSDHGVRALRVKPGFLHHSLADAGSAFKLPASETYTFLMGMMLFVDLVLVPEGLYIPECRCLQLLASLLDILFHPQGVTLFGSTLLRLADQYYDMYLDVYGELQRPSSDFLRCSHICMYRVPKRRQVQTHRCINTDKAS